MAIPPSIQPLPEKDLLRRISNGDEAAFTAIFYHYGKRVWWFIFQRVKSETIADDVVQEVFLKLWVKKEEVAEIDDLRAYIYTMAANKAYDQLKKIAGDDRKRESLWQRMRHTEDTNPVEEALDFRESQEMINQAIEQLPPQRKRIYQLNRLEGLSYEEIAGLLHISRSTVSNHLVEATRFIREFIRRKGGAGILLMILHTKFR